MIVVDSSAIMAILLREPEASRMEAVLEHADRIVISAGTLAEALIVASRRNSSDHIESLLSGLQPEIVPVTEAFARRVAEAYDQWGKGVHPAGLNIMDCFAYALAKEHGCPLLYVGGDFALTDVKNAI